MPLVGIMVNLYMGMKQQSENPSTSKRFETLKSLFEKSSALNKEAMEIFNKLKTVVWENLQSSSTEQEIKLFRRYDKMLKELEILVAQQPEVKQTVADIKSQAMAVGLPDKKKLEEELADDKLCQICCFQQIDTIFVPCEHSTCKKCIKTHMLNNEKCPFCNAEIKELKAID